MKDYENFVARMGSFDMDLTPPETDEDLLNHFGVKGMKWGVRKNRSGGGRIRKRVKREVGSFKREHAQLNIKDPSKMTDEELKNTLNRNRLENQFKAEVKKKTTSIRNRYSEAGRDRKVANRNAYLDRASLSDKELNDKVNRIRLENQLMQEANKINRKSIETGSSFVAGVASSLVKDMTSGNGYSAGKLLTNALISGSVDATQTYAKETKAEINRYDKPYG